jgi:thioredoxin-related protein
MYGVRGIPDTWLLTQKGSRIRNIRGYIEPDDLLSVLKEVRRQIK